MAKVVLFAYMGITPEVFLYGKWSRYLSLISICKELFTLQPHLPAVYDTYMNTCSSSDDGFYLNMISNANAAHICFYVDHNI